MQIIKEVLLWNWLLIGALISSYFIYLTITHSIDIIKLWYNRRNFKPPF